MLLFILSQSASSLAIPIIIASIGGVIVLVGLWLEEGEEKEWFSSMRENRWQKSKAKWGRWTVMFGVAVEIVTGIGLAVHDIQENRKNANLIAELEPRRLSQQQIFGLSNFLRVKERLKGTNISVAFLKGDIEAENFAKDISGAFSLAGMNLATPSPFPTEQLPFGASGLFVGFKSGTIFPSVSAKSVARGLEEIGFRPQWIDLQPMDFNNLGVIVGLQNHGVSIGGLFAEVVFDVKGRVIYPDVNAKNSIKKNGLHIVANGRETRVTIDFTRSLEVPPLLIIMRKRSPPVEALGEHGIGLSWNFNVPIEIPSENDNSWEITVEFPL